MSNNAVEKMITLRSYDKEEFVVSEAVGRMSPTIRHLIEDGCAQNVIPLPNVTATVLAKVIEYCKMHVSDEEDKSLDHIGLNEASRILTEREIEDWDREFLNVDDDMIIDLIWAANYLIIQGLLDLTCKKIAAQLAAKTPEEIRKHFHIKNDYTPEEEAEVRRENHWAFD
jgi:S-phase kinase-associated protein 1